MAELSNEELFNSALNDEPLLEVTEQVTEGETVARDEQGRFASKEEVAEKPKPEADQLAAKPVVEQKETVESPGVRQLREALERSNRRADDVERRLLALQPKQEPQAKPDIFENPDGFLKAGVAEALSPVEQRLAQTTEHWSRAFAFKEHGTERVTEAFNSLDQAAKAGDPQALAVVQAVKQSMDPFGDIVSWYAGNEASRNPDGFFQSRLEKALKDEKFRGELLTKLQPVSEEKPASVFQIPPKLGRAASAASALAEGGDLSNESLFEHSMR